MISDRDGRLIIEGPMTIATAASLAQAGAPLVAAADHTLDLAAVTTVDSAALAVVLGYLRSAAAAGRTLTLTNPPQAFSSLAALYGVDELLCIATHSHDPKVSATQP